jgi:hypothetical protein
MTEEIKKEIKEDGPVNVTGQSVAGTGDDPVHWGPIAADKKKKKNLRQIIRRKMQ